MLFQEFLDCCSKVTPLEVVLVSLIDDDLNKDSVGEEAPGKEGNCKLHGVSLFVSVLAKRIVEHQHESTVVVL